MKNKCTVSSCKVNRNRYHDPSSKVNDAFFENDRMPVADCRAYKRLLIENITYRACEKPTEKSDNSFALTSDNTYIRIAQFVVNIRNNLEYTIRREVDLVLKLSSLILHPLNEGSEETKHCICEEHPKNL